MSIRYLEDLSVHERRVFLRVDFNVPYDSAGEIRDDSRIREALPTIRYLLERKARLILASHWGRPQGRDPAASLLPVGQHLSELLDQEVFFPEDCIGDGVRKLAHELKAGQVLLLENLRFHPGEEANDADFSKKLAAFADLYVSDAFGTLHRAHASTVGMTVHFKEKGAGFLIRKELEALRPLLAQPAAPFVAVLGGAKVADKIGFIENLIGRVNSLLLGGALAYSFLRVKGRETGRSRVDEERLYLAERVLKKAAERQVGIYLPADHKVIFENDLGGATSFAVHREIPEGGIGVDIGPETLAAYRKVLAEAKTVFWNGPMGYFENPLFAEGTFEVARAIARPGVMSVVGGGESIAACRQAGVAESISHLSTGGGASLEFLEGKILPGLKALEVAA